MKTLKEGKREYASGIEKALRRATRQAELTAAATGTRLVIYEKGRITRVGPTPKISLGKDLGRHADQVGRASQRFSPLEIKGIAANAEEFGSAAGAGKAYRGRGGAH